MADDPFETLFSVAASSRFQTYLEAKGAILTLPPKELAVAVAKLKAIPPGGEEWMRYLTARILIGWLEHRAAYVQCAAFARGELPGPEPLPGFTENHRAEAIADLGEVVTPRVLEMVYKAPEYDVDDDALRSALFISLALIEDDLAVLPMIELLADSGLDEDVQLEVLNVLSRLGDPRGLDPILEFVNDPDADEGAREAAIRGLSRFEAPAASETLVEIVSDENRPLADRQAAATALNTLSDPATSAGIKDALADADDPMVKQELISVLGRIGTKDDVAALRAFAQDSDPDVAEEALEAIEEILAPE